MDIVVPPRLAAYRNQLNSYRFSAVIADASAPDCPVIWANARFFELTGYPPRAVIGRNCRFLQTPRTSDKARRRLRAAIEARRPVDALLENVTADGRVFLNHLLMRPFEPDPDLIVGAQNDVTGWIGFEAVADDVPATSLGTAGELRADVVGHWLRQLAREKR